LKRKRFLRQGKKKRGLELISSGGKQKIDIHIRDNIVAPGGGALPGEKKKVTMQKNDIKTTHWRSRSFQENGLEKRPPPWGGKKRNRG